MPEITTVCFTGHRDIPRELALDLPALLDTELRKLISRGAKNFRAGGAIGFDMVAALKVLELKEEFPDIKLILMLPCKDQTRGWQDGVKKTYDYILKRADQVFYTVEKYFDGCMLERDRHLVDGSDVCVAFCMKNRGGTAYTLAYAIKRKLEIINLFDLARS